MHLRSYRGNIDTRARQIHVRSCVNPTTRAGKARSFKVATETSWPGQARHAPLRSYRANLKNGCTYGHNYESSGARSYHKCKKCEMYLLYTTVLVPNNRCTRRVLDAPWCPALISQRSSGVISVLRSARRRVFCSRITRARSSRIFIFLWVWCRARCCRMHWHCVQFSKGLTVLTALLFLLPHWPVSVFAFF
jgi:hypothetical protein